MTELTPSEVGAALDRSVGVPGDPGALAAAATGAVATGAIGFGATAAAGLGNAAGLTGGAGGALTAGAAPTAGVALVAGATCGIAFAGAGAAAGTGAAATTVGANVEMTVSGRSDGGCSRAAAGRAVRSVKSSCSIAASISLILLDKPAGASAAGLGCGGAARPGADVLATGVAGVAAAPGLTATALEGFDGLAGSAPFLLKIENATVRKGSWGHAGR